MRQYCTRFIGGFVCHPGALYATPPRQQVRASLRVIMDEHCIISFHYLLILSVDVLEK
jgi:hypothetical protein